MFYLYFISVFKYSAEPQTGQSTGTYFKCIHVLWLMKEPGIKPGQADPFLTLRISVTRSFRSP